MSHSKPKQEANIFEKVISEYSKWLKKSPVLTKSITSAVTSGIANIISQLYNRSDPKEAIRWRSVVAFALFGFIFTGPLTHHFYALLDKIIPTGANYAAFKRVLIDRLVFAPPYLLLFYYVVAILEGKGNKEAAMNIRLTFWQALKMNWRIWTIFQYININYIPQQYRVLFASLVALGYTIYLSAIRK